MSKENDNLESLERELKELKKKKLEKEINKLEKELNIFSKKTFVQNESKSLKESTQKKKDYTLWIIFGVLFMAVLFVLGFGININSENIINTPPETQGSDNTIKNDESSISDDSNNSDDGKKIENELAIVLGLTINVDCQVMYKGGDKSTPPILKVSVKVNNSTSKPLKGMSVTVIPTTNDFRDYFKNDVISNPNFSKSVYYDINPINKDKVHTVYFYINSHKPGKAVGTCWGQA
jgi:hypothetical protein